MTQDLGNAQGARPASTPLATPDVRYVPAPGCRYCNGTGTYYEDVAGDGGSSMPVACDCETEWRTVTIPARAQHEGLASLEVSLPWVCMECGEPRGEPFTTLSYDGSRRLGVHGWRNPCGHVESYAAVREWVRREQFSPTKEATP